MIHLQSNKKAIPVLFPDDTSLFSTHSNFTQFHVNIETVLGNANRWLKNCLPSNIEKTYCIHFKTKNSQPNDIRTCLDDNRISNNLYTKFLGRIVDNTLSWKPNIDHLINKLSTACYTYV